MKAIIFLLLIPVLGISQESLGDVAYQHNGELITVHFGVYENQWTIVEVWQDNKLVITHKLKEGITGTFSFAKGELSKGKHCDVYVTRMRDRVLFRDHINVWLTRKPQVVLRVPNTKR